MRCTRSMSSAQAAAKSPRLSACGDGVHLVMAEHHVKKPLVCMPALAGGQNGVRRVFKITASGLHLRKAQLAECSGGAVADVPAGKHGKRQRERQRQKRNEHLLHVRASFRTAR